MNSLDHGRVENVVWKWRGIVMIFFYGKRGLAFKVFLLVVIFAIIILGNIINMYDLPFNVPNEKTNERHGNSETGSRNYKFHANWRSVIV
jgi:hypothetical protein